MVALNEAMLVYLLCGMCLLAILTSFIGRGPSRR